ncbi:HNH endonuclease [Rhizobium laguerreae]|uniref:HNH endonuclease n=1 Tax=Rhizobium laguerreae TaxID=1076926 RepID=UPI001C903924|nr:HNH endonuclease signature motif containing protein [Rhizobium laguerreae]MBY3418332.1 HNH endonuclease [Rhizobium laguerreae]
MKQLSLPPHGAADVFFTCVNAVPDPLARANYIANHHHMVEAISAYSAASQEKTWCSLPRAAWGQAEAIVVGSLSKSNLTDLYSSYMVPTSMAARATYDEIMVAANGKCPFCGGVGIVTTLDHYLPKSGFPLYSVLPANLVPCCKDCNTGKSSSFGVQPGQQPLHPYLDDPKFFNERWIYATVQNGNPIGLQYICAPPQTWQPVERERLLSHFIDYNLAYRYSVLAGAELAKVIDSRKGSLRNLSPEGFQAHLAEGAASQWFDVNGWNRTMYHALAHTPWFYNASFELSAPVPL